MTQHRGKGPHRGKPSPFLPDVPRSVTAIGPSVHGLTHAGPAAGSYLAEGRRAHVLGDQREAAGTVTFRGVGSFSIRAPGLGRAANVVLSPGLLRRDLVGSHGLAIETLLVAPELPLVVVQWSGPGHDRGPITLDISLTMPGEGSGDRSASAVERGPDGCVLRRGSVGLACGVSPRPISIEVAETEGPAGGPTTARATIRTSPSDTVTLILAGGDEKLVAKAFGAAAHLDGHAVRAAAGPSEGGLVLDTGVAEIDDGVAWARARIGGLVDRVAHDTTGDTSAETTTLLLGLAALAVGDREVSARASTVAPLVATDERSASPAAALLAARRAAVLGDVAGAAAIARAWASQGATSGMADDPALSDLARRSLADGLLHAVPDSVIAALRAPTGSPVRGGTGGRGVTSGRGRSLPMAGTSLEKTSLGTWLSGLLAGRPSPPAPSSDVKEIESARHATARFLSDPNEAWTVWRSTLAEGLRGGPNGPATWDADAHTTLTAELLLALVHGMLGVTHDAPAGRLGIAPRMPDHITAFVARGITLGASSVELAYERSRSTHLLRLRPEIATIPPLIVLEPTVIGRVTTVRIDGRPADLDIRFDGERSVVPVQLPLEGPREVEIVTA